MSELWCESPLTSEVLSEKIVSDAIDPTKWFQFVEWWGYSNSLGFPRVGESVWHFSRSICLTTFLPVSFLICPDICTSCLFVCLSIGLSVYCVLEAAAIRIPTVTRADPALIKKKLRNHNISADFVYLIYLINTNSVTLWFCWCM